MSVFTESHRIRPLGICFAPPVLRFNDKAAAANASPVEILSPFSYCILAQRHHQVFFRILRSPTKPGSTNVLYLYCPCMIRFASQAAPCLSRAYVAPRRLAPDSCRADCSSILRSARHFPGYRSTCSRPTIRIRVIEGAPQGQGQRRSSSMALTRSTDPLVWIDCEVSLSTWDLCLLDRAHADADADADVICGLSCFTRVYARPSMLRGAETPYHVHARSSPS